MFQSTSRCAQILMMRFSFPSKHALGLFLIKSCLFSLTTCKAVPFLTSAFLFGYLTNFKTSVLSNILVIPWGPVTVFLHLKTQEKWKLVQQYFDSWNCCQAIFSTHSWTGWRMEGKEQRTAWEVRTHLHKDNEESWAAWSSGWTLHLLGSFFLWFSCYHLSDTLLIQYQCSP